MNPSGRPQDRRTYPRREAPELAVTLRQRGQLARCRARVIDFNRFGMAVLTGRPLDKDRRLFISLRWEEICLENVVGVVHNCIPHEPPPHDDPPEDYGKRPGYRCGIRFRTRSELQLDQHQIEADLMRLERALAKVAASAVSVG